MAEQRETATTTATGAAAQPVAPGSASQAPAGPGADVAIPEWFGDRAELVRLAHRFVWSPEDAEDVVHDALLHARRNRDQLRDPTRATAWLRRIVVQHALLHRRRRRIHDRAVFAAAERRPARTVDPAGDALRREQLEALRSAIEALPAQQRIAVTLRHLEGMDYARIAEVMDVAEATVRFHVRHARLALAARLEDRP